MEKKFPLKALREKGNGTYFIGTGGERAESSLSPGEFLWKINDEMEELVVTVSRINSCDTLPILEVEIAGPRAKINELLRGLGFAVLSE